jgi:hypothetical protein
MISIGDAHRHCDRSLQGLFCSAVLSVNILRKQRLILPILIS